TVSSMVLGRETHNRPITSCVAIASRGARAAPRYASSDASRGAKSARDLKSTEVCTMARTLSNQAGPKGSFFGGQPTRTAAGLVRHTPPVATALWRLYYGAPRPSPGGIHH